MRAVNDFLPLIAALATTVAVFFCAQFLFNNLEMRQIRFKRNKLLSAYAGNKIPKFSGRMRQYKSTRSTFNGIGAKLVSGKYEQGLKGLLGNSGESQSEGFAELIYKKGIFTLAAFVFGTLLLVINGLSSIPLVIILVLLSFFLPDLLLKNRVIKRKQEIADLLPDAIDMLQMCVGAGLAFPAALSKVAETQDGPVAEEFARVTSEVQLGQSRVDALRAMAERAQEPHLRKFVSSMSQVDTFGIPISNVLQEQSKQMRAIRRERAREKGQKVPIKLLAPIMLCFLPCVMVIILGPAVLSIFRAFST